MKNAEEIYQELSAAQQYYQYLGMANATNLSFEERLELDVAYEKAKDRLFTAMNAKQKLVKELANGNS